MTTTEAPAVVPVDDQSPEPTARERVTDWWAKLRAAFAGWWVWTGQPLSYAEAWRQSRINPARIPLGAPWATLTLWRVSQWTDRLAWFALMLLVPPVLQGPLRWAATRPARRVGAYVLVGLVVLGWVIAAKGR